MHGVLVIFVICCLHISQAVMGSGRALYYNLRIIQIEANESEKKKRISETKVEEMLESMCDATSTTGHWIRKLDIDIAKENNQPYLTLTTPDTDTGPGTGVSIINFT